MIAQRYSHNVDNELLAISMSFLVIDVSPVEEISLKWSRVISYTIVTMMILQILQEWRRKLGKGDELVALKRSAI